MKSMLFQKMFANAQLMKQEIKPKTKEEQNNYGVLKSSADPLPIEKKNKKKETIVKI